MLRTRRLGTDPQLSLQIRPPTTSTLGLELSIHRSMKGRGGLSWTHVHDRPGSACCAYFPPYSYGRHLDLISRAHRRRRRLRRPPAPSYPPWAVPWTVATWTALRWAQDRYRAGSYIVSIPARAWPSSTPRDSWTVSSASGPADPWTEWLGGRGRPSRSTSCPTCAPTEPFGVIYVPTRAART